MLLPFSAEIFFYRKPIDFRKQIDGLMVLVADTLQMNPISGQIFIFRNKGRDRLKISYYEQSGFWFLYRRLEERVFSFLPPDDIAMTLTVDQFQWLPSGLDVMEHQPRNNYKYTHFY